MQERTVIEIGTSPVTLADPRRGGTSASNAEADLKCPGRHLFQKQFPIVPSGPDAEHGQLIHACLADSQQRTLMEKMSVDQRDTFDRCREVEKKLSLKVFPEQGRLAPVKVFREQRFWVKVDGKYEHSGQPDVVMRSGSVGLIYDFKTLPSDVPDGPENMQLRDHVVLAAGHLLLTEVWVAIVQPLVTMDPILAVYHAADIKRAEEELFQRVRLSNDPKSPRLAGEVQCKYCRGKSGCLEYQRYAGTMLPGFLNILEVPVSGWTPQQRAMFCDKRGVAQKWLDETEAAMKEGLAKDPNFVEGWYLAPGNERRTITDPQSVFSRFAALGGTVGQFMGAVSVATTKLKESLSNLTGARGKALEAAMEALTSGLVEVKQNAPSLKRKDKV